MANNILDNLIYKDTKPTFQTKVTPKMLEKLNQRQLETISAIQTANQALGGQLSDVSDFMTNLAMQESRLGKDTTPVSYSPFQIDPIGYKDIALKGKAGEGKTLERASIANKLLRDMGYGEDFDILGLSYDDKSVDDALRDPLVGALVTRMKLGTIRESIPRDLQGQANYWKKHWNTKEGKGKPEHLINQVQFYNKLLGNKTYDDTPLK